MSGKKIYVADWEEGSAREGTREESRRGSRESGEKVNIEGGGLVLGKVGGHGLLKGGKGRNTHTVVRGNC